MLHYTRPNRKDNPFDTNELVAPALLFQKWQAWDNLEEEKPVRKKCRSDYLNTVADAIQRVYETHYEDWYDYYTESLENLGSEFLSYTSVWRLIVGWGTNPTLETGLTLHHLYGFPYIPGTAVKGLLHHVAEMEAMKYWPEDFPGNELPESIPQELDTFLNELVEIYLLFGSLHLERAWSKDKTKRYGPLTPREALQKLLDYITNNEKLNENWKSEVKFINILLNENTGGILRFYDAVPEPEQNELLQVDIVNPHYGEYYKENSSYPPSDDQQPVPITFIAVRPEVTFLFPCTVKPPLCGSPRDKQEANRQAFFLDLSLKRIKDRVTGWLSRGLGLWGIGAKTAAGYGYFNTGALDVPEEHRVSHGSQNSGIQETGQKTKPSQDEEIEPVAPPPFQSKDASKVRLLRINKDYDLPMWQGIAANEYIQKVEGLKANLVPLDFSLPRCEISKGGTLLTVYYQNDRFYCQVEVNLQGVSQPGHARWVWKNIILPQLPKSEEEGP